jgi:hypothetical protein
MTGAADPNVIRRELPKQWRTSTVIPETINEERRSIRVTFASETPVTRYDWWEGEYYDEILDLDPKSVRLGRFLSGAPVLDSHNSWSTKSVLGVVENPTIENRKGTCDILFPPEGIDENADRVYALMKANILRNTSIGYWVYRYEIIKEEGKRSIYRATDWEPCEESVVPIGADPNAGVRSEGGAQKPDEETPTVPCLFIRRQPPTFTQERTMPVENQNQAAPVAPETRTNQPRTSPPVVTRDAAPVTTERAATLDDVLREMRAQSETQLRLMSEVGKLTAEVETLKKGRSAEVQAEVDAEELADFEADRTAGLHYWYESRDAALADFRNNQRRYQQMCERAPVQFGQGGSKRAGAQGTEQRSGGKGQNNARTNLRAPAAPAPEDIPTIDALEPGDDPAQVLFLGARQVQAEYAARGQQIAYDAAAEEFRRRYEARQQKAR